MQYELIGDFEFGDGWQCRCANVFFLNGKFFARHWTQTLNFHCSKCGTQYVLAEGELRAKLGAPTFAESHY
jgi:hypothetical protein